MIEFSKRIVTITILISILALLFFYGSNTSLVITIYLVTLLSFHEWLNMTSKSKHYILPFFILLYLLDYSKWVDIGIFSIIFLATILCSCFPALRREAINQEAIQDRYLIKELILQMKTMFQDWPNCTIS